jgi:hypothetical protein
VKLAGIVNEIGAGSSTIRQSSTRLARSCERRKGIEKLGRNGDRKFLRGLSTDFVNAHRDGKLFTVHAHEIPSGFEELQTAIHEFAVDLIS